MTFPTPALRRGVTALAPFLGDAVQKGLHDRTSSCGPSPLPLPVRGGRGFPTASRLRELLANGSRIVQAKGEALGSEVEKSDTSALTNAVA